MAQPTAYNRQASFSNIQAQAPSDPLPGATVDSEFNAAKVTLDGILANLALIQRDDGALANASVGLDQLSAEIKVGWQAPVVWTTATAYVSGDTVFNGSAFYRLLVAHTSGTFATDLAAAKWELIVDLSGLAIVAASQIANTPAGSIAATTVQAAIDELASEKAASSHTHPSSVITDSTAAGRSMLSAATAAAQRTLLGLGALALEDTIPVTDINAEIALSGIIEPAALNAGVNDWTPTSVATCSTIRASASVAGVQITGLLAGTTDGQVKILQNVGVTHPITLAASSASSAAANRFLLPKDVVIAPNTAKILSYDLDATTPRWRLLDTVAALPRSYLTGLTLSNDETDATNDVGIAVGEARGALGLLDLTLSAAIIKRLDADWAAGTNQGMRYSGAAITNTTYHLFLISKPDGTTDVFAYAGVDPSSVLPSGYLDYRRIGSILRESGVIVPFVQNGDIFRRKTLGVTSTTNPGISAVSVTLLVPTGIEVDATLTFLLKNSVDAGQRYGIASALDETDETPSITLSHLAAVAGSGSAVPSSSATLSIRTNTSAQIRTRISASGGNDTQHVAVRSWRDRRGRDS